MIVKMMKYNIVLLATEHERFIDALRETGLVDITTSGWEPSEEDRVLLLELESRQKAVDALSSLEEQEFDSLPEVEKGSVYATYTASQSRIAALKGENTRLQKLIEEWSAWGDFSVETLRSLSEGGVVLRYFVAQSNVYEKSIEEWSQHHNIALIDNSGGEARFVVITGAGDEDIMLDAQELKVPSANVADMKASILANDKEIAHCEAVVASCAAHKSEVESEVATLKMRLQGESIKATAEKAAEGMLLVLEGWAEKSTASAVDALLESSPNTVYIKSDPTPEDETPVKLKNNCFARVFELVGNMYAVPKYGTIDLTPFFAPFYMLFFAICLCDAGYGAVILAAGIALLFKGEKLRKAALFSTICGLASVVFGFFANSFFGMTISDAPMFAEFKFLDFQNQFFYTSLVIGIVQILFGMLINIVVTTRTFGFKNALGSLGWFLLILGSCLAGVAGMFGVEWYSFSSMAYMVTVSVALVLMLLLNKPSFNIFANFGVGLWDTYNNITGLLSDLLSYIRLFAIGLSGGVLALVFNSLALGLTGLDAGVEEFTVGTVFQIIGAAAILLVGHGINLFMSAISSFVHPMRLTFVEFFKNAGFEMGTRTFEPLKNEK